jgi:hypothetical protein
VDLYLDDSVDFAYPDGTEGNFNDLRIGAPSSALSFFTEALADEDAQVALEDRWRSPRALFRSKDKNGSVKEFQSGPVESFFRNVGSRLHLVSFDTVCSVLLVDSGEVELWLLRTGNDPAGLSPTVVTDTVARRFVVPARLLRHTHDEIAKAANAQTEMTRPVPRDEGRKHAYSLPE